MAELGEVTVNAREALSAHERGCSACRAVRAGQRQLLEDLAAPAPLETSEDAFVTSVMARTRATENRREPASGGKAWARALPWAGGLFAVAAAVAVIWLPASDSEQRFQARGSKPDQAGAIAADVFLARGNTLHRLADATLGAGDRLAVRVVNQTDSARFFMVFAIDAANDVHWIFPAYDDAAQNPEAPELRPRQVARVLPEMVEPAEPAGGALHVVSMLSDRRMSVKEIEERLSALPKTPLARIFPESTLREWSCLWRKR